MSGEAGSYVVLTASPADTAAVFPTERLATLVSLICVLSGAKDKKSSWADVYTQDLGAKLIGLNEGERVAAELGGVQ